MTIQSVREYYDATLLDYRILWMNRAHRAMHYGDWGGGARSHAESLVAMDQLVCGRLSITSADRVLDAGSGVGGSALWLARTRMAHVTGITPVPVQVRRARRYARQQHARVPGAPVPRFYVGDFTRTPFPDASFDVVWALESVCHAADKAAFFVEAHRLLRPGGRLGVAEYARVDRAAGPAEQREMSVWLSGWSMPSLATSVELVAMAADAGFTDVRCEDISARVARSSRRMHQVAAYLWPLEWWLHTIRVRNDRQHAHVLATLAQYDALRHGLWRYGLMTARASG